MRNDKSRGRVLGKGLTQDEQEALMAVPSGRIGTLRRQVLAQEIRNARSELHKGECRPATPDELMREIPS